MTNDAGETSQQKLLYVAINDRRGNISRHSMTCILELMVAMGIITILAITLVKLAKLQGEENSTRKRQLEREASEAQQTYESERRTSTRLQVTIAALEKITAAATTDPKRVVDLFRKNVQLVRASCSSTPTARG